MLQLRYGARQHGAGLEVFHLMDLLDRSYGQAETSE
jgi:hypothetical protein